MQKGNFTRTSYMAEGDVSACGGWFGGFAHYCFMTMSMPVKWRQKGSRAARGGSRKAPSTASGTDETKLPTNKDILALSGREGIKTERAKIVPAICACLARENRSLTTQIHWIVPILPGSVSP